VTGVASSQISGAAAPAAGANAITTGATTCDSVSGAGVEFLISQQLRGELGVICGPLRRDRICAAILWLIGQPARQQFVPVGISAHRATASNGINSIVASRLAATSLCACRILNSYPSLAPNAVIRLTTAGFRRSA